MKIPVYKPYINGNESNYINKCIEDKWLSSRGEFIKLFEDKFSNYISSKSSTSVSNGTVALHLALHTLGIKSEDEIIVPTLTYIASVNAIKYVGAKPVFVDSLPNTWNMDPEDIRRKITKKTKAILIVHLYGNPCAMDKIQALCKEHNLFLIEDAAEAFGSMYKEKFAGTFGHFGTFSFFGNKTITTGEGGMLTSFDTNLIKRAAYLKSQGVSNIKEYWHDEIGFNYRMTNICAAIGLAQLEQADYIIHRKKEINDCYFNNLKNLNFSFQEVETNSISSYWMVSILASNETERNELRSFLSTHGVETRPLFHPAHKMPYLQSNETFPIAENLSKRGLNLPSYPNLLNTEIEQICNLIKKFMVSK
jgi:perosamine synthetase